MVRVYDRPLLRSSARAEGAVQFDLIFDRFAMKAKRARMPPFGLMSVNENGVPDIFAHHTTKDPVF
jgi:hypothetical protein